MSSASAAFSAGPSEESASVAALLYKILGEKSFIQTPLPLIAVAMFFHRRHLFPAWPARELSIRTYHESQGKPTYLVASRDNLLGPARRSTDRSGDSRPPLGFYRVFFKGV